MAGQFLNRLFGPIGVLCVLLSAPLDAQVFPPDVRIVQKQGTVSEEERLGAVPCLKSLVSISVADMPLSEVLALLSHSLPLLSHSEVVRLVTKTPLGDQRVTLHVKAQPLHRVMSRLISLLDHGPRSPKGFYWIKENRSSEQCFRLDRTLRSIAEERSALDFPKRKAAQWLRDMRTGKGSDLPKDYLEDADFQLFRDALSALSDGQMEALIDGSSAPAIAPSLTEPIAKYNEQWRNNANRRRQNSLQNGLPDPFPGGIPLLPPDPPTIKFGVDDYNREHPERTHLFGLYLKGVALIDNGEFHLTFDPLEALDVPDPDPTPDPSAPQFDLGSVLHEQGVTDIQRGDSGFTLQTLGRVAGVELYEEHFLKTGYWGARPKGLRLQKGTLAQLIHAICKEWSLSCKQVGPTYLFWSRTWAQDRSVDIPERFLAAYRRRLARTHTVTLEDRIEIAGVLTWPQLRLTLGLALPEAGPWNSHSEAASLRLLAIMADDQRRAALSGEGFGVWQLTVLQREFLASDCIGSVAALSDYDPALLRLKMATSPGGTSGEQYSWLQLLTGANEIWSAPLLLRKTAAKTIIEP